MCFIERPVLAELGFDPRIKPMSVEQCVSEGLNAPRENRSRIVPGPTESLYGRICASFRETDVHSEDVG